MSEEMSSEFGTEEMADELSAVEQDIEALADNGEMSFDEADAAEQALEMAAQGQVPPEEMEEAADLLEAVAAGEASVGELAYGEQFLPALGPLIKGVAGIVTNPTVVSNIAGFIGNLAGGGAEEAGVEEASAVPAGRTGPVSSIRSRPVGLRGGIYRIRKVQGKDVYSVRKISFWGAQGRRPLGGLLPPNLRSRSRQRPRRLYRIRRVA